MRAESGSAFRRSEDEIGRLLRAFQTMQQHLANTMRQGIEQINQAVTQIDDVTQKNAALVEQAAAAAEAMQDQAENLAQLVRSSWTTRRSRRNRFLHPYL